MTRPTVSLLTIVKGRRQHLRNLLRGVARQTQLPDEVVIIHMNEEAPTDLPDPGCPVVQRVINNDSDSLPIGKARNLAANTALGDVLVFLDVDCIPHRDYVKNMAATARTTQGLVMGNALYLPVDSGRENWTEADLAELAMAHPRRPAIAAGDTMNTNKYYLFWSLCFAVTRKVWNRIGGFDEGFRGYSGEDTDLAFAARAADIPFYLTDATAYHQHHNTCSPPYNHLENIVVNAKVFKKKWGTWPMEGWLKAFKKSGHISWAEEGEELTILRHPEQELVDASRSTDPFA